MKFLDFASLARLCAFLDNVDVGEYQVHGDIEAYSCKLAGLDKKLCRSLEQEVQVSSSPQELSRSPVGPLSEAQSRKTLIYLILTLNHIYPDYDFNQLRAQHFQKELNVTVVEEAVDSHLLEVSRIWEQSPTGANTSFFDTIWGSINEAIDMQNCDVYSYKGDGEMDPLNEKGNVWSFNYFFYNKKLKRILYFTCRGQSKTAEDSRNTNSGIQFLENKSDADDDSSVMYGMAQTMEL